MTLSKSLLYGIVIALVLALMYLFGASATRVGASAPPGLPAAVATSSVALVNNTASALFATSSNCAARIISTTGAGIMLTFSDYANQSPTGSYGHWQGASTTIAYDSGQYGCGLVKAYSGTSQTITVSETR